MKNFTFSTLSLALVGLLAAAALAPAPALAAGSASSTITAESVPAIAISKTTDMGFGYFVPTFNVSNGEWCYINLTTVGVRTLSGGCIFPPTLSSGGVVSAASFAVSGQPNATYAITLPSAGTNLLMVGGQYGLSLQNFVSSPSNTGTLDGSGAQTLSVGAMLGVLTYVGYQIPNGLYSATMPVIIAYN